MKIHSREGGAGCGVSYVFRLVGRMVLLLAVYMLLRLCFYYYNRYLFPGLDLPAFLTICRGGLRFDIAALFYMNLLYLFLALLPFPCVYSKFWQKSLKGLFVVGNAAAFAANIIDFAYFRFSLKRTDFSFFREFQGQVKFGAILFNALQNYWGLLLLFIVVVAILVCYYGRTDYSRRPAFTLAFFLKRSLSLCLFIVLGVIGIRSGTGRATRPISMSDAGAYVNRPLETAIVLNTPFCIIRTSTRKVAVERLHYFADEQALEAVYTPLHRPRNPQPALTSVPEAPHAPSNVVVLILESFSKEHIGALNPPGHPGYTPFLDSLCGVSHTCTRAYANGKKSIEAIPSVLGSIPSLETPFVLTPYALNDLEGMGHLLGAKGYRTAFFYGGPNGSMGLSAVAPLLGFERYYGKTEYANDKDFDGVWGIWDEPFLQFFAHCLDTMPQPFAAALFTVSSHHPFKVPQAYEGKFPKGEIPLHHCIGYTDNALRLFFATARTMSWFKNTLFVLTADHGLYSELYPEYRTPEGRMSIPILYYYEGRIVPCMDDRITQQIDILPTVLSILQYPDPYIAFGRNIADPLTVPFAFNFPNTMHLIREPGEKDPSNEVFKNAFLQQYNNRMIDNRLRAKPY